jgi:hypothetical protein
VQPRHIGVQVGGFSGPTPRGRHSTWGWSARSYRGANCSIRQPNSPHATPRATGRPSAAQKRVFNEYSLLDPVACLRNESAANAAGIVSGPAAKALREWIAMQDESDGDSVFLTNPGP